jgi:hypothetical protein
MLLILQYKFAKPDDGSIAEQALLPACGSYDRCKGGAARSAQQSQHPRLPSACPDVDRLYFFIVSVR